MTDNTVKINVLYLADSVTLASKSGDLIHVMNFVNSLAKKGISVRLIIRGQKNRSIIKGVEITMLPSWKFPFSVLVYPITVAFIIVKSLSTRPSFIYQRDNGFNFGVFVAKLCRIPVAVEVNGNFLSDGSAFSRNYYLQKILKVTYSLPNLLILPSRGQLSIFKQLKASTRRFAVIPNGVNHIEFVSKDERKCRELFGLQDDVFYFGFVGNMAKWQGLETAVLAMSKLKESNPDLRVKLLLAGDGASKQSLQTLILKLNLQEKVVLLGYLPHNQVPDFINALDVCIAPFTRWRNDEIGLSPIKIYEYLSCGKPVIASQVFGTEIISQFNAGILVEPDNPEDLKNAFLKAIELLPHWKKASSSIHNQAAINCSWDKRSADALAVVLQSA